MVDQYQAKHNRMPSVVLVHPVAAVVLGYRKSLPARWQKIPVICREFDAHATYKKFDALGIYANLKAKPPCLCATDLDS